MKKNSFIKCLLLCFLFCVPTGWDVAWGAPDYVLALRRARYLLNGRMPTNEDFNGGASNPAAYQSTVRTYLQNPEYYNVVLRYHERLLGTGLNETYLQDLKRSDIDGKENKFASITCRRRTGTQDLKCYWNTRGQGNSKGGQCPPSWEIPVGVFWKPNVVAWVCPSVARACGQDLSRCFINWFDSDEARNAELGASEIYDSQFSVLKSLSRQPAGLATALVVENFPYKKILEPGVTAVDGAIANFLHQGHQFDLNKLHASQTLINSANNLAIKNERFTLVLQEPNGAQAGILSTFAFLRRYEKNRTRANQTYERLLCRKFTAELPRVFPQDPGNLRTTPGCSGCHSTLDPLADFFTVWGEGGDLYAPRPGGQVGTFIGKSGNGLATLGSIIREDEAFATCTVQNVWYWLMGRHFYRAESDLRNQLATYFRSTGFSFNELVFAIVTHPAFVESTRTDATVTDPIDQPPLGKVPEVVLKTCEPNIDFTAKILPNVGLCTSCHYTNNTARRIPLETEAHWRSARSLALGMMASGNMPPGQQGPPTVGPIFDFKEDVRCWMEQNP